MRAQESKNEHKRAIWVEHLREARAFGGSMRRYCLSNGISYARLQYWRSRIEGKAKKAVVTPSAFARVEQERVVDEVIPRDCLGAPSGARFVAEVLWHLASMGRSLS